MLLLLVGIMLLILAFFHGIFSSGFVPILHEVLDTSATFAFSLYFLGLSLGQLAIYWFGRLSKSRFSYPIYEICFGLSLIFMAIYSTPFGFILGRLIEGIAGGMTTPLIFASLVKVEQLGTPSRRIAMFNSVFALGYVSGPPLVGLTMEGVHYTTMLWISGIIFILTPMLLFFLPVPLPNEGESEENLRFKNLFDKDWFRKFYPLFLTKCLYGFLMAFTAGYVTQYIKDIPLYQIMLIFSIIFVIGQVGGEFIARRIPTEHMEVYIPLILLVDLVLFYFTHSPILVYCLAFFHSVMALVGYLNFGLKATSAREFALFNSLSDPAMFVGASFAGFGIMGIWCLIPFLVLPWLRFFFMAPQRVRAEAFFPFVGPLIFSKIPLKHATPLKQTDIPEELDGLRFNYQHTENEEAHLRLLFSGDIHPRKPLTVTPALQQFIGSHDLRFLNLEGPFFPGTREHPLYNGKHRHRIIKKDFETFNQVAGEPLFNHISCVNNHMLDFGVSTYQKTRQTLKEWGVEPLESQLKILEVQGVKVGLIALSFGSNFFWRRHGDLKTVKPEDITHKDQINIRLFWQQQIRTFKSQVDLLIMSYHWGYESEFLPSAIQKEVFDIFHEAGVDILYGHHSHIVQPFEMTANRQGLCLYSCGNLTTTLAPEVYHQGVLYSVELNATREVIRVEPHFVHFESGVLQRLENNAVESYRHFQHLKGVENHSTATV